MIAMFIQSFTESRLLFEGNWMLFVVIATWVKVRGEGPVVWLSVCVSISNTEYAPVFLFASGGTMSVRNARVFVGGRFSGGPSQVLAALSVSTHFDFCWPTRCIAVGNARG